MKKQIIINLILTTTLLTALTACGKKDDVVSITEYTESESEVSEYNTDNIEEMPKAEAEEDVSAYSEDEGAIESNPTESESEISEYATEESEAAEIEVENLEEDEEEPVEVSEPLSVKEDIIDIVTIVQTPDTSISESYAGQLPLTKDGEVIFTFRGGNPGMTDNPLFTYTGEGGENSGVFYVPYKDTDGNEIKFIAVSFEGAEKKDAPIYGVVLMDSTYALSENKEQLRVGKSIEEFLSIKDAPSRIENEDEHIYYEWSSESVELLVVTDRENTIEQISYLYMEA